MPKSSALIFGSTSEIGKWIIEGLYHQKIHSICLSRQDRSSQVDFSNFSQVLSIVKEGFERNPNISSAYFCIGRYAQSDLSASIPLEWIDDITVNLVNAYIFYRAISETLGANEREIRLVFLGSTASVSKPNEFSSYAVAKSGLEVLINYINNEKPSNIRACCLRLGTCKTGFSKSQDSSNVVTSDDIAHIVQLLENISFHVFPDLISLRPIRRSRD